MRDIESKLAGLVEGTFGRIFRSEVTPAELARGLSREMETSRRHVGDRTWVAHHYEIFLSPGDHRRIVEADPRALAEELAAELLIVAREQRFALAHPPQVVFRRGDELPRGRYGVRATHDDAPEAAAPPERPARRRSPTGAAAPVARPRPAAPDEPAAPRRRAGAAPAGLALILEGRREPLPATGGTIGRSRDCDVVIASAEVSRQHCELRPRGDGWVVFDLGSTNGVRVNGAPVGGPGDPAPVRPGDRIELGTVVLRVEEAL
nr:DUF3662 and FHA domain-containing protein [Patulibacter sp. SYSU D01012]